MTSADELILKVEDEIAYLFLNRPQAHNAVNLGMWKTLPQILKGLLKSTAKVLVISGMGSSFAAGADLGELSKLETHEEAREYWFAIRDCLAFLSTFELVTIAMINGPCLGGGCLLALACDLRYASDTATFGIPVSRLGIVLDDQNLCRLVNLVGPSTAKELIFVGSSMSSREALSKGLLNNTTPAASLPTLVQETALQIARNSKTSLHQAKLSFNRISSPNEGRTQDEQLVINSYLAEDFRLRIARQIKA